MSARLLLSQVSGEALNAVQVVVEPPLSPPPPLLLPLFPLLMGSSPPLQEVIITKANK